jgi:hypothetical protein
MERDTFSRLEMARYVEHDIYRQVPGDDYDAGLDDLGVEPIASIWPVLNISVQDRKDIPDYFASGGKPIVSDHFRALCERFVISAEFLPIRIHRPAGTPPVQQAFWVLHPLERIDCINVEESIFEMYGKPPNFIVKRYHKLVFRPDVIGRRAVFRPLHDPALYVSAAFRQAAEELKLWVRFSALPGSVES